jgi:hypothetical protein
MEGDGYDVGNFRGLKNRIEITERYKTKGGL